MTFTHVSEGKVRMVDISHKDAVARMATAEGFIKLKRETVKAILRDEVAKGNVIATANIAGVLAVKRTPELIPMCHPIPITSINFDFDVVEGDEGNENDEEAGVKVKCTVKAFSKTGVEMEAVTGVSAALLTIWDMVKSLEKDESGNYPVTAIKDVRVVEKIVER
jgi:cyclic pyranopterin phosphate synthase